MLEKVSREKQMFFQLSSSYTPKLLSVDNITQNVIIVIFMLAQRKQK